MKNKEKKHKCKEDWKGECYTCGKFMLKLKPSKVKVWKTGNGFFIEVKDEFAEHRLAITYEELKKIVLLGGKFLIE